MKLSALFCDAIRSDQDFLSSAYYAFPEDGQFVHIPKKALTCREKALLQPFIEDRVDDVTNPWHDFLSGQGSLPIPETDLQLLFLYHSKELSTELKDLFRGLFPNLLVVTRLTSRQSVIVLQADALQDTSAMIKDLLPTIESDFDLRLEVLIGHIWTGFSASDLETILTSEYAMSQQFYQHTAPKQVRTFPQALLWSLAKEKDAIFLSQQLQGLMARLKDGHDLVLAMWQEQGNLAQTAQRLFIHRNSLQYRLDKFYQTTGLNLKHLDDLALAYLVILKEI